MNIKRVLGVLIFLNGSLYAQNADKDYAEKIAGSSLEIPLVFVPAGEYTMGSNPEEKYRKERTDEFNQPCE